MVKRKSKKQIKKKYSWIMFWIFSSVLFINNSNQILSNWFTLTNSQLNMIAWVGIIGSLAYVLWLKD